MPDLLLELFSEEIPARMQRSASEALQAQLIALLNDARLMPKEIKPYYTPRRIAFILLGLPAAQPDIEVERKGPATNAPAAAIEGFLRSTGLTKEQCEIRAVGKQECYFAVVKEQGKPTAEALVPLLNKLIAGYTWPKSMRWGNYEQAWVRPLQNICCLLDSTVVPVSFAHISANNKTYGHRFLAPREITLKSPADYEAALEKAKVIADAEKRKKLIAEGMNAAAAKLKLEVVEDDALLEEVTGLVEWPVILQGRIGDEYMDLPPEVLRSEMRNHQKYFNLAGANAAPDPTASPPRTCSVKNAIAPEFLLVSNLIASDSGKAIIAGNERVLRARLADGRFYWDQDRKKPLADWAKGLDTMIFHAKIGSMTQKVERITKLAGALVPYIPGADKADVIKAAQLCKADLVSGMVGEFPELQGIMGRYYALAQGEKPAIADAIRDHYAPLGPSATCPTAPVSIAIALADKFDSLISLFAIGEKPTGSKDPFALRRAALGCIRLILENKLRLPLKTFLSDELIAFFADRLKVMLRDQGHRHDLIEAVFTASEDDLARVMARATALSAFLATEDGKNLLAAYKRAANIVRIESKKDNATYTSVPDAGLLKEAEEKALHATLRDIENRLPDLLAQEDYENAMSALATLRAPVDAFFDKVTVNAENADLRKNRLLLLSFIQQQMERVADFGKVETVSTR